MLSLTRTRIISSVRFDFCVGMLLPLLKLAHARVSFLRACAPSAVVLLFCYVILLCFFVLSVVFAPPLGGAVGGVHTGLLLDIPVWTDTFLVSGGGFRGFTP